MAPDQGDIGMVWWWYVAGAIPGVSLAATILMGRKISDLEKNNRELAEQLQSEKDRRETSGDIFKQHTESASKATEPFKEIFANLEGKVDALSQQIAGSRESFEAGMSSMTKEARRLSDTLQNPTLRGAYGEVMTERILELSGLKKGIHYDTQYTLPSRQRVDFVVNLSDDRVLILDTKTPLKSLQAAHDATDEAVRSHAMEAHVRAVRKHIDDMSAREYWNQFDGGTIEAVIIVLGEYAYFPAVERDGDIFEYALEKKVILTTPSTLLALLKTVRIMWKQSEMSNTVREIGDLSKRLNNDLVRFTKNYAKAGKQLTSAVAAYDASVATWRSKVLPHAKELADRGAFSNELLEPKRIGKTAEGLPDAET